MADATFSGAEGVWFLRKVLSTYSGNCIEVKRASDDATQDIGFGADGRLDVAALEAFCGASVGRINKWYDQSGNGLTLTPSTDGPTICEHGKVKRKLGEICAWWSPGSTYLEIDLDPNLSQPGTVFVRVINWNDRRASVFCSSDGASTRWQVYYTVPTRKYAMFAGTALSSDNDMSPNWINLLAMFNGANSELYQDGKLAASGNAGSTANSTFRLGTDNTGGNRHDGFCAGAVIWDSDQSGLVPELERDAADPRAYKIARSVLRDGQVNGTKFYGRSSLVDLGNDKWLSAYREGSDHGVNDGTIELMFSSDHGQTWGATDTFHDGTPLSGWQGYPDAASEPADALGPGEPWIIKMPNGDICLFMWKSDYNIDQEGTWMTRSTDGGKTWSTPAQVDWNTGGVDNQFVFATDDHYHNPNDGYVYVGGRIYSNENGTQKRIGVWKTGDNGATWEFVNYLCAFSDNCNEVGMEYLGDGSAIALLRINSNSATYKVTTGDNWATVSALENLYAGGDIISPFSRVRLHTLSHLMGEDNWEDDTRLIASGFRADTVGSSPNRTNALLLSHDSGEKWELFPLDIMAYEAGYNDLIYDSWTHEVVCHAYYGPSYTRTDVVQYRIPVTDLFPAAERPRANADSILNALATVDAVADAIKAVTDNLPDSGALTAIGNNASTAATQSTTAATNSTAIKNLAEADRILEDVSGVQKLKIYEKGTSTELITAKTAKQPGGANLTNPATQRLAGYRE